MRALITFCLAVFLAAAPAFAAGAKGAKAACENGLKQAERELDFAKAKGLGGTWEITKAATLLTGARIQSGFGKYRNCVDKVRRARAYIARSRRK